MAEIDPKDIVAEMISSLETSLDADIYLAIGDMAVQFSPSPVSPYRDFDTTVAPRHSNAILVAWTFGGILEVPFNVAKRLIRAYGGYTLYVHGICKSAGALLAIGASEIVMSDTGELGPLDVQVMRKDELGERMSGLDTRYGLMTLASEGDALVSQFLNNLRNRGINTERSLGAAADLAVGMLSPVYGKIDLTRLGENTRQNRVAIEYGRRLSSHHENLEPNCISKLTDLYPEHGFIIDRDEAAKLFCKVREPNTEELALLDAFTPLVNAVSSMENGSLFFESARQIFSPQDESDEQNERVQDNQSPEGGSGAIPIQSEKAEGG